MSACHLLTDVITPTPSDSAQYNPEDFNIDPTQYEKLLQYVQSYLSELLGRGMSAGLGVEMSVGALLGDEVDLANGELLNVSEEDEKLTGIALENLSLEDVLKAAGYEGAIRPDAE